MKKTSLVCLAIIVALGLGGCAINKPREQNNYIGKYAMVDKIQDDGLSFEDLGIKSELMCVEIKDNNEVNVCVGGWALQKAKLVTENEKTYIKLEAIYFNGFGNRILLGEKKVEGKEYLTFEDQNEKRAYLERLSNDKVSSELKINKDGTFEAMGNFKINVDIQESQTGKTVREYWGSGFVTHGSGMKINDDGIGKYSVGVAEFENFKLIKEDQKTYMEIINKQYQEGGVKEGRRFLVEAKKIDKVNCLVVHKDDIDEYWVIVGENDVVFEWESGRMQIWSN